MSKVFIEEETLIGIGNAIREKNGTTDLIATTDMATAISNLPTGNEGNWDKPIATTTAESQIIGTKGDNEIIFDFSSKIKPYDFLWEFGTFWAGATSGSTKYLVSVNPINVVFPNDFDGEVKVPVRYWEYGKSGTANNTYSIYPSALYITGYYNPTTCQLRLVPSGYNTNQFKYNTDDKGQLYHHITE